MIARPIHWVLAVLLFCSSSYAPDDDSDPDKFFVEVQDWIESGGLRNSDDWEEIEQYGPFFLKAPNDAFWSAHRKELENYSKSHGDPEKLRDDLRRELKQFLKPPQGPSNPGLFKDTEADMLARSRLEQQLRALQGLDLSAEPDLRRRYDRLVHQLTQQVNPLAGANSPPARNERSYEKKSHSSDQSKAAQQRQMEAFHLWREARLRDAKAQLEALVHTSLTELCQKRRNLFLQSGNLDPVPFTPTEVLQIKAEVPTDSGVNMNWRGDLFSAVVSERGELLGALGFKANLRRLLLLRDQPFSMKTVAWAALWSERVRYLGEVIFALQAKDLEQLEARLKRIPPLDDFDNIDEYTNSKFLSYLERIEEEALRKPRRSRAAVTSTFSDDDLNPARDPNPERDRVVYRVVSKSDALPTTQDPYFRTKSTGLKLSDLRSVKADTTAPVRHTIEAIAAVVADSEGLISIPSDDLSVPVSARAVTTDGKTLKEGTDYEIVVAPTGDTFLKLRGKKFLETPLAVEMDFADKPKQSPSVAAPGPELDKKVLREIAQNMQLQGLGRVADKLIELTSKNGPVYVTTLSSLLKNNSLYTYMPAPARRPDKNRSLLMSILGSFKAGNYLQFEHLLVPYKGQEVLALQCVDAAKLLHEILKSYSKLKPEAPIPSRIVTGHRAVSDGRDQLLHEVGHAWVEVGEVGGPTLRLDSTPSRLDPNSPKRAAVPQRAVMMTARDRVEASKDESVRATWERIQQEMEKSAARIHGVLEKDNREFESAREVVRRLSSRNHPFIQLGAILTALHLLQTKQTERAYETAKRRLGFERSSTTTGSDLVAFLVVKAKELAGLSQSYLKLDELGSDLVSPQRYAARARFAVSEAEGLQSRIHTGIQKLYRPSAPDAFCAAFLRKSGRKYK